MLFQSRLPVELQAERDRTPCYFVVQAGFREELFQDFYAVLIESGPHVDLSNTLNLLFQPPQRKSPKVLEVVCLSRDVKVWSKAAGAGA